MEYLFSFQRGLKVRSFGAQYMKKKPQGRKKQLGCYSTQ